VNVKLQAYSQALMSCRLVSVIYSDMETACRRDVDHMENRPQGPEQVNAACAENPIRPGGSRR